MDGDVVWQAGKHPPSWQSWFNGVWIPAFAGMTVAEHPPSLLTRSEGGRFLAALRNDREYAKE